ncbi:MAG: Holliday junction branch migration protein RuvA [Vulcanimicrobiota bacterium]
MIYQIDGEIINITSQVIVVNVNGVGYGVNAPQRLIDTQKIGNRIRFFTLTIMNQDGIALFGFLSSLEREFFKMLLNIPRVGPKGALKILSSAPAADIIRSILEGDHKKLSRLPGIGAKTAQRLVIELKEKVDKFAKTASVASTSVYDEILEVLIDLGCPPPEASEIVKTAKETLETDEPGFDDLLSECLSVIAREEK